MAGEDFAVRVGGLDELTRILRSMPAQLRKRALRTALAAGARIVRDVARRHTPVLASPIVRRGKLIRKPRTVRDAISVRTSKVARSQGNVGVFVNVRPAKGALFRGGQQVRAKERGADSPKDPYYWRWLEFGRSARAAQGARKRVARVKRGRAELVRGVRARRALRAVSAMRAFGFLRAGAQRLTDALRKFETVLGPQIQKLNDKGRL